ncbi:hypothetical protein FO519_009475, partial [Halicephalobus sp. NKZ332]
MRRETYNILVLGQSGVGKSTWINSIANYFTFENFENALGHPPKYIISTSFKMIDDDGNRHVIKMGETNKNENTEYLATSCTLKPQVYSFRHPDCNLNIIDVPGIGDTRGVDVDNTNIKAILDTVSLFSELHAICVLIKSTDTVLNTEFRYCLNELLMHLHKYAIPNVVFIFTNSIASNFRPGNGYTVLEEYLNKLRDDMDVDIPLSKDIIYCIDNEAFRFQGAYYQVESFRNMNPVPYKAAWDASQKATKLLFNRMRNIIPHNVKHTLSVNQARAIIISLIQPLVAITSLIQANAADYQKNFDDVVHRLQSNLTVNEYDLKLEELERPRTVCTAKQCISVEYLDGIFQTFYKQICHSTCYLEDIPIKSFPEEGLRGCTAMRGTENCRRCKCSYKLHMHIDYNQKRILRSSRVADRLAKLENIDKVKAESELNSQLEQLKKEQEVIINAMLEFTVYLSNNALFEDNNAFEELMRMEIRNQEAAVDKGAERNTLDNLTKTLNDYLERERVMKDIREQAKDTVIRMIDSNEVGDLQQQLFNLPLYDNNCRKNIVINGTECIAFILDHYKDLEEKEGVFFSIIMHPHRLHRKISKKEHENERVFIFDNKSALGGILIHHPQPQLNSYNKLFRNECPTHKSDRDRLWICERCIRFICYDENTVSCDCGTSKISHCAVKCFNEKHKRELIKLGKPSLSLLNSGSISTTTLTGSMFDIVKLCQDYNHPKTEDTPMTKDKEGNIKQKAYETKATAIEKQIIDSPSLVDKQKYSQDVPTTEYSLDTAPVKAEPEVPKLPQKKDIETIKSNIQPNNEVIDDLNGKSGVPKESPVNTNSSPVSLSENKFIHPVKTNIVPRNHHVITNENIFNVLVIGQSGVGKSTLLNALKNYLTYETAKEALEGDLQYIIPCKFAVYDEDYKKIIVPI